ncbi:Kinesin-like protein at 61F [Carabus blaptoides fortunei]
METDSTMRVYLRQMPKRENEYENNEANTEVPSKAAICNLYPYDRVFNEYCNQDYIFRCALKRTILYALDGYNVTTIAYGHSGTGKTHTIFGGSDITKPEDDGMLLKSVAHLFEVIGEEQLEYFVTVSYLDIFNEKIYDLLSTINDDTELNINENMDENDSVVIEDLTVVTINNMPELCRVLKIGDENRVKSSSLENSLSSQRHSLFYVTVYTKEESVSGDILLKRGSLIFVDAAASDYSTQSDQTNMQSPEDVNTIHQSLNTFNECMMKLANGSTDIPYG